MVHSYCTSPVSEKFASTRSMFEKASSTKTLVERNFSVRSISSVRHHSCSPVRQSYSIKSLTSLKSPTSVKSLKKEVLTIHHQDSNDHLGIPHRDSYEVIRHSMELPTPTYSKSSNVEDDNIESVQEVAPPQESSSLKQNSLKQNTDESLERTFEELLLEEENCVPLAKLKSNKSQDLSKESGNNINIDTNVVNDISDESDLHKQESNLQKQDSLESKNDSKKTLEMPSEEYRASIAFPSPDNLDIPSVASEEHLAGVSHLSQAPLPKDDSVDNCSERSHRLRIPAIFGSASSSVRDSSLGRVSIAAPIQDSDCDVSHTKYEPITSSTQSYFQSNYLYVFCCKIQYEQEKEQGLATNVRCAMEQFLTFNGSVPGMYERYENLCNMAGFSERPTYEDMSRQVRPDCNYSQKAIFDRFIGVRMNRPEYKSQDLEGCTVVIIGAGPVGLRSAIEVALLGGKAVVLEKRCDFTRPNILHLWTWIQYDLIGLGAKVVDPSFGASSAFLHIGTRDLQIILYKVHSFFSSQQKNIC